MQPILQHRKRLLCMVCQEARPFETFPFERVNEAYERMMSGKARFRVVLTMK